MPNADSASADVHTGFLKFLEIFFLIFEPRLRTGRRCVQKIVPRARTGVRQLPRTGHRLGASRTILQRCRPAGRDVWCEKTDRSAVASETGLLPGGILLIGPAPRPLRA